METNKDTTPKYYLVIDLEATCDENHAIPRDRTEIIEIGAVLCDAATLQAVDEFQTFVRPIRHPRLTAFCTELTTITQADVATAPPFPAAIARLGKWLSERHIEGQFVFCSWGDYDKQQFSREARHHHVRLPLGARHINLKQEFATHANHGRAIGTWQALRAVGLTPERTHHRAIDDARNIARLLGHCGLGPRATKVAAR